MLSNIYMIEKIEPKQLRKHIWRIGPYMTYFSGNHQLINKDIEIIIKEMSKKYTCVKILEIDWESYVDYEKIVDFDNAKKVNVYFEGKIKFSVPYPDFNKIYDLFHQCQKFYLERFQKESLNVMTPKSVPSIRKRKQVTRFQRESKTRIISFNKNYNYYRNKYLEDYDVTNIESVSHDNITLSNSFHSQQFNSLKGSFKNITQPEMINNSLSISKNPTDLDKFQNVSKIISSSYYFCPESQIQSSKLKLHQHNSNINHKLNFLNNDNFDQRYYSKLNISKETFQHNTKLPSILKPQIKDPYNMIGINTCKEKLTFSHKTNSIVDLSTSNNVSKFDSSDTLIKNFQSELRTPYPRRQYLESSNVNKHSDFNKFNNFGVITEYSDKFPMKKHQ